MAQNPNFFGVLPEIPSGFYSYLWLRKDGTPYYVGKGRRYRAFTGTSHCVKCPSSVSRILIFPMASEAEAFESEIALIELFGRKDLGTGCLRNLTDGGEGPAGQVFSSEAKLKMSLAGKGRKKTAEHRAKLSESQLGISKGKGRPWSAIRRAAVTTQQKTEQSFRARTWWASPAGYARKLQMKAVQHGS